MTKSELLALLRRRRSFWRNKDEYATAYGTEDAIHYVHQLDDRSDAMIEWVRERLEMSKKSCNRYDAWFKGRQNMAEVFLDRFDGNKPKEPNMTLAEIAKEAKEGDKFNRDEWEDIVFNQKGDMVWARSGRAVIVSREDTVASDWKFTHRTNHCPHCGKPIEGR